MEMVQVSMEIVFKTAAAPNCAGSSASIRANRSGSGSRSLEKNGSRLRIWISGRSFWRSHHERSLQDVDPQLLLPVAWQEVKEYFIKQSKQIADTWLT